MNELVIIFCFLLSLTGFALVFLPCKRKKSNKKMALVYSALFLAAGIYMVFVTRFSNINWKKEGDAYRAKRGAFQSADLIKLDESLYTLFMVEDKKLIEMFADENMRCQKQPVPPRQKMECQKLLEHFPDRNDFHFGVLIVHGKNRQLIYLVKNETDFTISGYMYVAADNESSLE